jgi:hypothetical protein
LGEVNIPFGDQNRQIPDLAALKSSQERDGDTAVTAFREKATIPTPHGELAGNRFDVASEGVKNPDARPQWNWQKARSFKAQSLMA